MNERCLKLIKNQIFVIIQLSTKYRILSMTTLYGISRKERERVREKTSFINFEREKIDFRIYTFAQFQFSCNFLPPLEIYSYYMLLAQTLCSSFNYIYVPTSFLLLDYLYLSFLYFLFSSF